MAAESDVVSEIEVLQSIYLDELQVVRRNDGGWEVSLVLYPSTAEDSLAQFVRLMLTLTLDLQYPSSPPIISIHNPRGLSDDKLCSVQRSLQTEAESSLGSPVLYQLIEKAKEILTQSNIPHGNCVICLYGFKDGEAFTKTTCYHHFHSHCLGRYITHSETELRERERELEEDKTREKTDEEELTVDCPVCREPLTYDVDHLLSSPAPSFPKLEGAVIGADFRHKWTKLQTLLERQKAKGGIIDPEAESNRFLIHINEAPPDADNAIQDVDASLSQSQTSPPTAPTASINLITASQQQPQPQQHTGQSHRRGGPGHHRRQDQFKWPRRGGRGRLQHGRPVPPTEHLDKLTLSSEKQDHSHGAPVHSCDAPLKTRLLGNPAQQKPGNPQLSQLEKAEGEGCMDLSQPEAPPPGDGLPMTQPCRDTPKTDSLRDTVESGRGRGNRERGRRKGPPGSARQPGQWQERHFRGTDRWDSQGGVNHHHGDGRGQRSRGGNTNPCRGGRPSRGSGSGFHHRVVEGEVGREGVL